ncbi:MAG TPA: hypothetical protein VH080_08635, partial [Gemmatimonadaceae bacterium]|nr:hypothetical protein [Gemmatimonadaceae bacterium]
MIPTQVAQHLDEILDHLVKNVEGAVHAFYRGDVKQNTGQVRSDQFRKVARESLLSLLGGSMTPRPGTTLGALGGGSSGNAALLE